jgi:hypothetical protein
LKKINIILLVGLSVFILNGCDHSTREYRDFVKKYGSNERYFCDGKFLMKEKFLSPEAKAPQLYLINSQKCHKE